MENFLTGENILCILFCTIIITFIISHNCNYFLHVLLLLLYPFPMASSVRQSVIILAESQDFLILLNLWIFRILALWILSFIYFFIYIRKQRRGKGRVDEICLQKANPLCKNIPTQVILTTGLFYAGKICLINCVRLSVSHKRLQNFFIRDATNILKGQFRSSNTMYFIPILKT